jgi:hypothetical protein
MYWLVSLGSHFRKFLLPWLSIRGLTAYEIAPFIPDILQKCKLIVHLLRVSRISLKHFIDVCNVLEEQSRNQTHIENRVFKLILVKRNHLVYVWLDNVNEDLGLFLVCALAVQHTKQHQCVNTIVLLYLPLSVIEHIVALLRIEWVDVH